MKSHEIASLNEYFTEEAEARRLDAEELADCTVRDEDLYRCWSRRSWWERQDLAESELSAEELEAANIQRLYQSAITRDLTYYWPGLGDAVLDGTVDVLKRDGGYLCGRLEPIAEDPYNPADPAAGSCVFHISHYAPRTMRAGVEMLADMAGEAIPVICTIPAAKAAQLERLGWHVIWGWDIPQVFDGALVVKTMCLNDGAWRFRRQIRRRGEEVLEKEMRRWL